MTAQVFIVEDHPLMRRTVHEFIESGSTDLAVCDSVATGEEALERLSEVHVDLALIDVSLPGMNGLELVVDIKRRWPDLVCLILSGHAEATYVKRALAEGARGYVTKGNPLELMEAIRQVLAGGVYLSESMRGQVTPPDAHGDCNGE